MKTVWHRKKFHRSSRRRFPCEYLWRIQSGPWWRYKMLNISQVYGCVYIYPSPCSISWCWPKVSDDLRLGR